MHRSQNSTFGNEELHNHAYKLEEHIVNLESNQVEVRRKALKYINEKGSRMTKTPIRSKN